MEDRAEMSVLENKVVLLSVQCTVALLAYHVMAAAPQKATVAPNSTHKFLLAAVVSFSLSSPHPL